MADNLKENPIGRTISVLNLRDEKTNQVAARKASMKSFSATSGMGSPSMARVKSAASISPRKAPDAIAAIPYSTGTPTEAAAALAYFQTLERQRDEAVAKNAQLEEALAKLVTQFGEHVTAVEASVGPLSQYYAVTFGAGHIGMILTSDDAGQIEVAELRDEKDTGRPLLAKASGKIFVGDHVIAVNSRLLARYGPPTPEQVAAEFRSAARPMMVLFKRNAEARLKAAMAAAAASS
jgi:hypothetical protein